MKSSYTAWLTVATLLALGLVVNAVARRNRGGDFDGFYEGGLQARYGYLEDLARSGTRRYPVFFRVVMAGYTYLDRGVTFGSELEDDPIRLHLDTYPTSSERWPQHGDLPMRIVPPVLPVVVHGVLNVVALVAAFWLVIRMLPEGLQPRGATGPVLAVVLMIPFVYTNVAMSQVNAIILGLSVLGMALIHRKCDLSAGAVWGLAACIKVTPLVLVAWAVYRFRWKAVLAALAAMVLFGVLAPAAYLGWDESMHQQRQWLEDIGLTRPDVITQEIRKDRVQSLRAKNMSLRGAVLRLGVAAETGHLREKPTATDYRIAAAEGRPRRATLVVVLVGMVLAVAGLWPPGRVRAGRTHWHDLSLMAFLMLVISPIVWSHYLIFMLPAVTALACLATAPGHSRRLVMAAGVTYLIMMVSSAIWQLQAVALPIVAAWVLVAVLDVASRRYAPAENQQPLDSSAAVP